LISKTTKTKTKYTNSLVKLIKHIS